MQKKIIDEKRTKEFHDGLLSAEVIEEYENDFMGTTSYYVSGLLFEHWNLEPLYVDMLKGLDFDHDLGNQMDSYIDTLDVVRLAINVREVLSENSISIAAAAVEDLGFDSDHFIRIAQRIKDSYK